MSVQRAISATALAARPTIDHPGPPRASPSAHAPRRRRGARSHPTREAPPFRQAFRKRCLHPFPQQPTQFRSPLAFHTATKLKQVKEFMYTVYSQEFTRNYQNFVYLVFNSVVLIYILQKSKLGAINILV